MSGGEALVRQIADLQFERDVAADEARRQRKECALWKEASNTERKRADAAEAQVAPLRDEIEGWKAEVQRLHAERSTALRAAIRDLYRSMDERREVETERDAAESALRQVRELANEWTAEAERLQGFADKHQGYYLGVVGTRRNCRDHLLAILDSARVGAADTQPEGAGEVGEWKFRDGRLTFIRASDAEPEGARSRLDAAAREWSARTGNPVGAYVHEAHATPTGAATETPRPRTRRDAALHDGHPHQLR